MKSIILKEYDSKKIIGDLQLTISVILQTAPTLAMINSLITLHNKSRDHKSKLKESKDKIQNCLLRMNIQGIPRSN